MWTDRNVPITLKSTSFGTTYNPQKINDNYDDIPQKSNSSSAIHIVVIIKSHVREWVGTQPHHSLPSDHHLVVHSFDGDEHLEERCTLAHPLHPVVLQIPAEMGEI